MTQYPWMLPALLVVNGLMLYFSGFRAWLGLPAKLRAVREYTPHRWTHRMTAALDRKLHQSRHKVRWERWGTRIRQAGLTGAGMPLFMAAGLITGMLILFLRGLATGNPLQGMVMAALGSGGMLWWLRVRRKRQEAFFERSAYRIYHYLHNQVDAGIRVTDALVTAHLAASHPFLRRVLIRMAARFELTRDIQQALDEIRSHYRIPAAETLCMALRQGVETGDNSAFLARQEAQMFSRYMHVLQSETDAMRFRATLSMVFLCAVIVLMIGVVFFRDARDAVDTLFSA